MFVLTDEVLASLVKDMADRLVLLGRKEPADLLMGIVWERAGGYIRGHVDIDIGGKARRLHVQMLEGETEASCRMRLAVIVKDVVRLVNNLKSGHRPCAPSVADG